MFKTKVHKMAGSVGVGVFLDISMVPELSEKLPEKIGKKIRELYKTIIFPGMYPEEMIDSSVDLTDEIVELTRNHKDECSFGFLRVHGEMQTEEEGKYLIFVGVEILEPDDCNVKNCVPLEDLTNVMARFASEGDLHWLKTKGNVVLARLWEG